MMGLEKSVCLSPGSHLDSLVFSPPPEDINTSRDSNVDQPGFRILLDTDSVQEPPTPAGFSFLDGQEGVKPLVSCTLLLYPFSAIS
jgi:hypothetical protein